MIGMVAFQGLIFTIDLNGLQSYVVRADVPIIHSELRGSNRTCPRSGDPVDSEHMFLFSMFLF